MNRLQEYELKKEFSELQELSHSKMTGFKVIGNENEFSITDKSSILGSKIKQIIFPF